MHLLSQIIHLAATLYEYMLCVFIKTFITKISTQLN